MKIDDFDFEKAKEHRRIRHVVLYDLLRVMFTLYDRYENPFLDATGQLDKEHDAYIIDGKLPSDEYQFDKEIWENTKLRFLDNGDIEVIVEHSSEGNKYSFIRYTINFFDINQGKFTKEEYFEDEDGGYQSKPIEILTSGFSDDTLSRLFYDIFKNLETQIKNGSAHNRVISRIPDQVDFLDKDIRIDLIISALRILRENIQLLFPKLNSETTVSYKRLRLDGITVPVIVYSGRKAEISGNGDLIARDFKFFVPLNTSDVYAYSGYEDNRKMLAALVNYCNQNIADLKQWFDSVGFADCMTKLQSGEEAYYEGEVSTLRIPNFLSDHLPALNLDFDYIKRELVENGDSIIMEDSCTLENPSHELTAMLLNSVFC